MILLLALGFSIIVALLRGGRFVHLADTCLRYGWLAIWAFAMQSIVIYFPERRLDGVISWESLIIPVTYSTILLVGCLNIKVPGISLIVLGLALNLVVMFVNGGFMPVTFEALSRAGLDHMALGIENGARVMASKDVILSKEVTRLWFLSDVLVLEKPLLMASVFSVGDVVLASGVFVLLQRAMRVRTASSGTESH